MAIFRLRVKSSRLVSGSRAFFSRWCKTASGFSPRKILKRLFALGVGGLVCACSLSPTQDMPLADQVTDLPEEFIDSKATGPYQPLEWWKAFADPVLDQIVEAVLASNFDLEQAVARVDQARARARIANATMLPLVQPAAGINDFEMPTNAGIGAQLDELGLGPELTQSFGLTLPDRLGLTMYSFGAEFSYELDFWGRNRNDARAANAARLASESDYLMVRIGVLSETVRTYLEIVDLREQRRLAGEIIEILRDRESFTESRYDRGLSDSSGLYAARRNLRDAQARLPRVEAMLANAEGRLWVLLGGYSADLAGVLPDSLSNSAALEPVPPGIPAGLLVQRPDVSAARQRMEAARFTVGARRADLLPSLSLSGSIGLQSPDSSEWFDPDQWFHNLSLNLLGPAFQGKRLRNNVAMAEARLKEAAAAYGHSVITAVSEVETSLAGLQASSRRHQLLASFLEEAQAETTLQEQRYVSGVGNYGDLLEATQYQLGAQSVLAAAQRELGYARLALHRALGGAWTADEREASGQNNTAPTSASPVFAATNE
ncbi:MAG: efflux transporter outer membrane subunit [Halieaceae bacterium]|nr:efflux transporter outer membrane subunit [Halieaceae bacterium]